MPASNVRHVIAVTRSGAEVEDRAAFEDDEEVLANIDGKDMAFDDDRRVPYYLMLEEGLPPTWVGDVHVYTGGSHAITQDAWWMNVKAPAIYMESANAMSARKDPATIIRQKTGKMFMIVGVAIGAFFLILTAFGGGGEEPLPVPTPPPATVAPAILPGDGPVEDAPPVATEEATP